MIEGGRFDLLFKDHFRSYRVLREQKLKAEQVLVNKFEHSVECYVELYPVTSDTFMLFRGLRQILSGGTQYERFRYQLIRNYAMIEKAAYLDVRIPTIVSPNQIMKENRGVCDPSFFMFLPPSPQKMNFEFKSSVIPQVNLIWAEFTEKLNTIRANKLEFNTMFSSQYQHQ